ncbi:MAG: hypothetical protein WCI21_07905, partial [Alphaproteobacteria bacterium]
MTKAVVAATLVLTVGYAAYAVLQIGEIAKPADTSAIDSRAGALAARMGGDVGALHAAMTAAAAQAARSPNNPVEAAETGLAAAGKAA